MDGETLKLLANSGNMEQLKACGFIRVKDQLKLRKLAIADHEVTTQVKNEELKSPCAVIRTSTAVGKLSMTQIKQLSHADKHLYLLK